jgi:hypothetical protein
MHSEGDNKIRRKMQIEPFRNWAYELTVLMCPMIRMHIGREIFPLPLTEDSQGARVDVITIWSILRRSRSRPQRNPLRLTIRG